MSREIEKLEELLRAIDELNSLSEKMVGIAGEAFGIIKGIDLDTCSKADARYLNNFLGEVENRWRDVRRNPRGIDTDVFRHLARAALDVDTSVVVREYNKTNADNKERTPGLIEMVRTIVADGNSMQHNLVLSHDYKFTLAGMSLFDREFSNDATLLGFPIRWVDGNKVCRLELRDDDN